MANSTSGVRNLPEQPSISNLTRKQGSLEWHLGLYSKYLEFNLNRFTRAKVGTIWVSKDNSNGLKAYQICLDPWIHNTLKIFIGNGSQLTILKTKTEEKHQDFILSFLYRLYCWKTAVDDENFFIEVF